jgi:cell division protein FtsB
MKSKNRSKAGWLLVGLGILLAVRMSFNIWRVYRSGSRISQAQAELDMAIKQQNELKGNLAWVQSPEFVEKEAREKLGMGKPGEVVLILPKFDEKPRSVEAAVLVNWQKWWSLYVGLP